MHLSPINYVICIAEKADAYKILMTSHTADIEQ